MRSTLWRRALLAAGLVSLLGAAPLWLLRADRPEEEEEPPGRPAKVSPAGRPEEEEEGTRPRRKVIRVEEDDAPSPTRPGPALPDVDLRVAAREARHPAVRSLFAELAVPHDVVVLKARERVTAGGDKLLAGELWVEPLPEYVTNPRDF